MTTPNSPRGDRPVPTGSPAAPAGGHPASAGAHPAPRPNPLGSIVPLCLEVGAWLLLLTSGAIAFGLAGLMGFFDTGLPADLYSAQPVWEVGEFDLRHGAIALTVLLVVAAAGLFLPQSLLSSASAALRGQLLSGFAAAAGLAGLFLFFFPAVWLAWLTGLLLAVMVALLVRQAPGVHRKPWRSVGVAAGLGLFVTYIAQIASGVPAGVPAQRWLLLLAVLLLIAAAVGSLLLPVRSDAIDPATGAFPQQRRGRGQVEIARPWACYVLFAALGVIVALPQIVVADLNFGQAGTYAILCASLVGWAAGFEAGPTFAPGMTRPRLTAFALLVTGVLLLLIGALEELSGMAILSGAAAFAVGVGVRAQPYVFTRRIGFGIGAFVALILTWIGTTVTVPVTDYATWQISTTEIAYVVPGLLTLIAGITAVVTFSPLGVRGLGVDLVHAFRAPVETPADQTEASAGQVPGDGPGAAAALGLGDSVGAGQGQRRFPEHGLFIAFEGGDGVGKTTQIRRLSQHLASRGFTDLHATREPGGTEAGARIRQVLLEGKGVGERAEALLFAADRAHHVAGLIDPKLAQGSVVMTDRYIDSSLAYQAAGRELSVDEIAAISRWATTGLLPQLTIILDMDPAAANARTESRGEANHLDEAGLDFHARVRQAFLDLAHREPDRYIVINADRHPDEVAVDVAAAVDQVLASSGIRPQPPVVNSPAAEQAVAGQQDDAPHAGAAGAGAAGAGAAGSDAVQQEADERFRAAPDEAETTVLPADRKIEPTVTGPAAEPAAEEDPAGEDPEEEPATTVLPGGSHAAGTRDEDAVELPVQQASTTAGGDDETTVLPPRPAGSTAEDDETTVLPPRPAADAEDDATTVLPLRPAEEAETTVMPRQAQHDSSRRKLQAQAEIERQARERLREARMRGNRRGDRP